MATKPSPLAQISKVYCLRRRAFLRSLGAVAIGAAARGLRASSFLLASPKKTDIRIENLSVSYQDYLYRAPIQFGSSIMDRATVLTVNCSVRTFDGRVGSGFGSMPFNHIFSFPSKRLGHETKNAAMKVLAEEIAKLTRAHQEFGHPLEINWSLAPLYLKVAAEVSQRLGLIDSIPRLCTLVTASAFDAAIHDAYGKVHGLSCFHTLNPEFMNYDLAHYLGPKYRGLYPERYIFREPKTRLPLCHLISAADPIEPFENLKPINDGLPETIPEWIQHNGLIEFKIKVLGENLNWDVERVLHIDQVVAQTQRARRVKAWHYVLDFNEKCPNLEYFMQFLGQLKEKMPMGFKRIRYVEQPTARDLRAHPENDFHRAARICPVVIDESLIDIESLLLARRLGWTGAVVKSPKGLSHMILVTSVAGKEKIFLCGGDMSCPGGALIQTANFQARIRTISAIEANARQYLPQANKEWELRFRGMFETKDGWLQTRELAGPGLGA